jgi:hypothetical protein
MLNLDAIFGFINTPIGIGVFAGLATMVYLILMSINSYLPPVLLLSLTIGYIVYYVQRNCPQTLQPGPVFPPVQPPGPIFPPVQRTNQPVTYNR